MVGGLRPLQSREETCRQETDQQPVLIACGTITIVNENEALNSFGFGFQQRALIKFGVLPLISGRRRAHRCCMIMRYPLRRSPAVRPPCRPRRQTNRRSAAPPRRSPKSGEVRARNDGTNAAKRRKPRERRNRRVRFGTLPRSARLLCGPGGRPPDPPKTSSLRSPHRTQTASAG